MTVMATTIIQDDSSRTTPLLSTDATNGYSSIDNIERNANAVAEMKHAPGDVESDILPETSVLGRNISWKSAYMLTISRVLGSGIFATPGVILTSVGSPGLSLLLWIVGATIAYFGLTIALEYGSMLPRSGGSKVYLEFTYRKPKYFISVIFAVNAIILGLTASNCIVFAQYTLFASGIEGTEIFRKVLAVGLLTCITLLHTCFRRAGIAMQDFLGCIKISMIIFMIISGVFVIIVRPDSREIGTGNVAFAAPGVDWSWNGLFVGSIWSWGAIATSIIKVFYAFAGLENVNNVLNEVKKPTRTLRSVALTSLVTACGMYALANVAYFLIVPLEAAKNSGELIAALYFERVFGDTIGRRILPIMVALSAAGNVMVVTFALARLNQEIARTGLIPFSRILSTTAPFGSPIGGLIVHYIPSALVLTIPSGDIYSLILEAEGYSGQLIALAVAIGLVWLRFKRPELHRPYKAWIPGVVSRAVVSIALILAPFFPSEAQKARGSFGGIAYAIIPVSVLAAGVLYWYVFTSLLPKYYGYKLEDQTEILEDGTTVRRIAKMPLHQGRGVPASD